MSKFSIINLDVREGLSRLASNSIHCVVTSPPYWGLRAYGTTPQIWGGSEQCRHLWEKDSPRSDNALIDENCNNSDSGKFCKRCGAWIGELGSEPTPYLFVNNIAEIFRDIHRVLHPSGTVWLNLGDSYAGSRHGSLDSTSTARMVDTPTAFMPQGLKPKDACMVPFRLALALQADGWWVRSVIPWLKRNPMPENCVDRPGTSVEYFFLLSKSQNYFYDNEAVKLPVAPSSIKRMEYGHNSNHPGCKAGKNGIHTKRMGERFVNPKGRHRRNSDWFFDSLQMILDGASLPLCDDGGHILALPVNNKGNNAAHYATYSERLIYPCIKAGSSEHGCCAECSAPYERAAENNWQATCSCKAESVPCRVLDPFSGTGTTGAVAIRLGREYIGIELNSEYADYSKQRLGGVMPLFTR